MTSLDFDFDTPSVGGTAGADACPAVEGSDALGDAEDAGGEPMGALAIESADATADGLADMVCAALPDAVGETPSGAVTVGRTAALGPAAVAKGVADGFADRETTGVAAG